MCLAGARWHQDSRAPRIGLHHRHLRADLRAAGRHHCQLPPGRQRDTVLDDHRGLPVLDGGRLLPVALLPE